MVGVNVTARAVFMASCPPWLTACFEQTVVAYQVGSCITVMRVEQDHEITSRSYHRL